MIRNQLLFAVIRFNTMRNLPIRTLRMECISHIPRSKCLYHVRSINTNLSTKQPGKTTVEDEDSPVKRPGRKSTAAFESSPSPSPQKKLTDSKTPTGVAKRRRIVSSGSEDETPTKKTRFNDANIINAHVLFHL